ncbi:hypothetical protein LCGC14_0298400 [marine sediment metagenome]|uniref:Uncharacterized protein n=1 Tax=marine sediment metagenome TaxID=412755 RepID=A0A0F9TRB1_9ZZZZ
MSGKWGIGSYDTTIDRIHTSWDEATKVFTFEWDLSQDQEKPHTHYEKEMLGLQRFMWGHMCSVACSTIKEASWWSNAPYRMAGGA